MAVEAPVLRRETEDGGLVEERIRPQGFKTADALDLLGAAFGSFCLAYLLYERLTPLSGGFGFFVTWYAFFLAMSWFLARNRLGMLEARDQFARVVVGTVAIGLLIPLTIIVGYTISRGYHALRPQFFTQDLREAGPLAKSTTGGGSAAVIGSLEMVGIATVLTVPLGIATAIFLNEIGGRLARPLRMIVDAMSAIPSIVAGLFVYASFVLALHQHLTGFAAALALAVLMLPTVTRTAEVVLRLVPGGLREASLALGGGEWATVRRVILPTARTGLLTAVILGIARIVGETAPLILTTLGNTLFNANPFKGKQDALPLFIYRLVRFPQTAAVDRAWAGALALLGLVLALFIIARIIGGRGPGHIGRFKRARLARKGLA
ncbi:MAG: phosphate transport system permease protein [Actinomycetota bacterium]|nr:phosphate transport system permease protein [Actinomycetota bacterium]